MNENIADKQDINDETFGIILSVRIHRFYQKLRILEMSN